MTTVVGTMGDDVLIAGVDFVDGNDYITGREGLDVIFAGGGDDTVVSIDTDKYLNGGTGTDYLRIFRGTSSLNYTFSVNSQLTSAVQIADGTQIEQFERVHFVTGSGNDTLTGGDLNDHLDGGSGTDLLIGGAGNDRLVGGAGDTLLAGTGDYDNVVVDSAPVLADGGAGAFDLLTITGSAKFAQDSLLGFERYQVVDGAPGAFDIVNGTGGIVDFNDLFAVGTGTGVTVSTTLGTTEGVNIRGSALNDRLVGGDGDDRLVGGRGNDTLVGGEGDDTLNGESGNDRLFGEAGDDYLVSQENDGIDRLDGGAGTDYAKVSRSSGSTALTIDLTDTTVLQNIGDGSLIVNVERIFAAGGSGNDTFTGGALNDRFTGGAGEDTIFGAGGNDAIFGGLDDDRLDGGVGGTDTLIVFENTVEADYSVLNNGDGTFDVTYLADGSVDTVSNFERVLFENAGVFTTISFSSFG